MKHHILFLAVSFLLLAAVVLFPGSKRIDTVVTATEYSFADPDFAETYPVTVRGFDTRNVFGWGEYRGVFSAEGWETAQDDWTVKASFPMGESYRNTSALHPSGYTSTASDVCTLLPDAHWRSFVVLLQEVEILPDGSRRSKLDPETGHFLVSGTLPRDEALTLARQLSKGTGAAPYFENR